MWKWICQCLGAHYIIELKHIELQAKILWGSLNIIMKYNYSKDDFSGCLVVTWSVHMIMNMHIWFTSCMNILYIMFCINNLAVTVMKS